MKKREHITAFICASGVRNTGYQRRQNEKIFAGHIHICWLNAVSLRGAHARVAELGKMSKPITLITVIHGACIGYVRSIIAENIHSYS